MPVVPFIFSSPGSHSSSSRKKTDIPVCDTYSLLSNTKTELSCKLPEYHHMRHREISGEAATWLIGVLFIGLFIVGLIGLSKE